MKAYFAAIAAAIFILVGLSQAQTKTTKKPAAPAAAKLGDAYATAALRAIITKQNPTDLTKFEENIRKALEEMEAQVSSPAEQKSFDGIKELFDDSKSFIHFMVLSAATERELKTFNRSLSGSDPEYKESDDASARTSLADAEKPCYDALKANLKRRDGTMPKECVTNAQRAAAQK